MTFCIGGAVEEYDHKTGGIFWGVNRTEGDQRYLQMNDSTVYFDIAPQSFFGIGMPMNHFWYEERIRVYLRYIKRLEIRMPSDTLVYDGEEELTDLFLDNKVSKQEVKINIRKRSVFNPILDYFNF